MGSHNAIACEDGTMHFTLTKVKKVPFWLGDGNEDGLITEDCNCDFFLSLPRANLHP